MRKPAFLKKIVSYVGAAILTGAVGFFGATLAVTINDIKETSTDLKLVKKDLEAALKDIQKIVTDSGSKDIEVKDINIRLSRVEAILGK